MGIVLLFFQLFAVAITAYVLDKYKKEPLLQLLMVFFVGLAITIPIVLLQYLITIIQIKMQINNALATSFLNASLVEEGVKFLALFIFLRQNKYFNERVDGIVYTVYLSLGFMLIENISSYFSNQNVFEIKRIITSNIVHVCNAVIMGFFIGNTIMAKKKLPNFLYSFSIPFFIHGLYNLIVYSNVLRLIQIILIFILPLVILSTFLFFLHLKSSRYK